MFKTNLWFDLYVGTAMACHLAAIALWCFLFKKINHWVWACILTGMSLIVLHCAGYFTNSLVLSQSTALSNSALALFSVVAVRHSLKRQEAERKAFMENLQEKTTAALELTKVLNAYKAEISYYEKQAKQKGIPLFKESNVG